MSKKKLQKILKVLVVPVLPLYAADVLGSPLTVGAIEQAAEEVAVRWAEASCRGVDTDARAQIEAWADERRVENAKLGGHCGC